MGSTGYNRFLTDSKMDFKKEIPAVGDFYVDDRRREAQQLLKSNPRMVPTILEATTPALQAQLTQNKYCSPRFLIPTMYTFHEFTQVLRRRLLLDPSDAVVLMVGGNVIPEMEQTMGKVYEKHKSEDLFLYVSYTREVVYG